MIELKTKSRCYCNWVHWLPSAQLHSPVTFSSFALSAFTSYESSLTSSEWRPKLEFIFRNCLHNIKFVFFESSVTKLLVDVLWNCHNTPISSLPSPLKYTPANVSTEIHGLEGIIVLLNNLYLLRMLTVTREKKVCLGMSSW